MARCRRRRRARSGARNFPRRSVPERPSRDKSHAPAARSSGKDRPPRGFPPGRRRASCRLRIAAARSDLRCASIKSAARSIALARIRRLSRSIGENLSTPLPSRRRRRRRPPRRRPRSSRLLSRANAGARLCCRRLRRERGDTPSARGVHLAAQGGKRGALAKLDAGGIGAQRRIKFRGCDDARVARGFGRADQRVRVGEQRRLRGQGIGRARDEEEFAPFSIRRRTR